MTDPLRVRGEFRGRPVFSRRTDRFYIGSKAGITSSATINVRQLPEILRGRRPCSKSTSAPMSKPTVGSPVSIPFSYRIGRLYGRKGNAFDILRQLGNIAERACRFQDRCLVADAAGSVV